MPGNISQIAISVIVCLFVILLLFRNEQRMKPLIQNAIYGSFPLFKDAVDNFQQKIDYLTTRVEVLEARISKLEDRIKQ